MIDCCHDFVLDQLCKHLEYLIARPPTNRCNASSRVAIPRPGQHVKNICFNPTHEKIEWVLLYFSHIHNVCWLAARGETIFSSAFSSPTFFVLETERSAKNFTGARPATSIQRSCKCRQRQRRDRLAECHQRLQDLPTKFVTGCR